MGETERKKNWRDEGREKSVMKRNDALFDESLPGNENHYIMYPLS